MKWASWVSERDSLEDALNECCASVRTELGSGADPDLVIAFTSPHHDQPGQPVAAALRARFPHAVIIGCSGAGVIGAGREVEQALGLSLTVGELPEVDIHGFHVRAPDLPTPDAPPQAWAELFGVPLAGDTHFVVLAEPMSIDSEALLAGMDYAFPDAAKIGGLASGGNRANAHALYLDSTVLREGAVGVALSGNIVVDTVVAQGCRPIGDPMRVTEAERNLLVSVDDEAPLNTLQRMFERMSPRDRELVQHNLFMGIAMDPLQDQVHPGDFVIRNVVGLDPQRGTVAVGALLREGQIVQFHVRDAETSAEDLRASLSSYLTAAGDRTAAGALLFSCTGRGRHLYGRVDHDTGIFREMVGSLPLGGFFCNGEIGPVAGTTYLHGYTSSFAIFRPRTVFG